MDNRRIIVLREGTLTIGDGYVLGVDSLGNELDITPARQQILRALADNLNHPVKYEVLFRAYSGNVIGYRRELVVDLIHGMPQCIKSAIKNQRNVGYRLIGEIKSDATSNYVLKEQQPHITNEITTNHAKEECLSVLVGDYYGFFLDPTGTGAALGAYIRVGSCTEESGLVVNAVLGIRTDAVLYDDVVNQVFLGEGKEYFAQYERFREMLSENDKRCFWGSGQVRFVKNAAEFTLITPRNAKWTIMIDIGNYLGGGRSRHSGDDGKYRGGLGVYAALSTQYGTFCGRFGIVRREFHNSLRMSLKNSELQEMLKLSRVDDRKPLSTSPQEDNYWYSWFMSE